MCGAEPNRGRSRRGVPRPRIDLSFFSRRPAVRRNSRSTSTGARGASPNREPESRTFAPGAVTGTTRTLHVRRMKVVIFKIRILLHTKSGQFLNSQKSKVGRQLRPRARAAHETQRKLFEWHQASSRAQHAVQARRGRELERRRCIFHSTLRKVECEC